MTKQTKWPTHVDAATWPCIRVARRVTPWQPGADWQHRGGRGELKIAAWADVSVTTPGERARLKPRGYGEARGVLSIAPAG